MPEVTYTLRDRPPGLPDHVARQQPAPRTPEPDPRYPCSDYSCNVSYCVDAEDNGWLPVCGHCLYRHRSDEPCLTWCSWHHDIEVYRGCSLQESYSDEYRNRLSRHGPRTMATVMVGDESYNLFARLARDPDDAHDTVEDDPDDRNNARCACGMCYDDPDHYGPDGPEPSGDFINSYSYRPYPLFRGDGPRYLGMELEVEVDRSAGNVGRVARIAQEALGDLGYLKEDGSIHYGFELVTHPLTYPVFMDQFPWDLLAKLRDEGCHTRSGNGIHVHVSKAAFATASHRYRWLQWWHRSQGPVKKIARRHSTEWASFSPRERKNSKEYSKIPQGTGEERYWSPERYSAVNVLPLETYEVRVFRSTLNPLKAKAALGLVDSTVEYTAELTAHDACVGKWGWQGFAEWLADGQREKYQPLRRFAKQCRLDIDSLRQELPDMALIDPGPRPQRPRAPRVRFPRPDGAQRPRDAADILREHMTTHGAWTWQEDVYATPDNDH